MMIKPIETVYNGYHFRSRLEARWAVFFDALGIKYNYEKEGFMLPKLGGIGGKSKEGYLPDFWLPQQRCFIEIKGQDPTKEEIWKCGVLNLELKQPGKAWTPVYLLAGNIGIDASDGHMAYKGYCMNEGGLSVNFDKYIWAECNQCHSIGLAPILDSMLITDIPNLFCPCHKSKVYTLTLYDYLLNGLDSYSPRLIAAYSAARQARFEHGETPHV